MVQEVKGRCGVSIALNLLRSQEPARGEPGPRRPSPSLLLLHALGGSSADWGTDVQRWPAPVYALDFSGHGDSEWLPGGGYTPENFAAEADHALAELGRDVRVVGAGLGAYVALLLSGARPGLVSGTLLLPGRGLAGGGSLPDFEDSHPPQEPPRERPQDPLLQAPRPESAEATDPLVFSCECDIRPVDYAEEFARRVKHLLVPLPASAYGPVPWLETAASCAAEAPAEADLAQALRALASHGR